MRALVVLFCTIGMCFSFAADGTKDIEQQIKDLTRRLEVMKKVGEGYYETSPPKLEWERKIIIDEVQKAVSQCKEPYRRWSDGSVSFLGKELFIRGGIIPRTSDPKVEFLSFKNYRVLDVSQDGCRVVYKKDEGNSDDSDAFIVGLKGVFSGRAYEDVLFARYVGPYAYNTVAGGSRTIPKYEYGTPISKEEFIKAVSPKGAANQ
jgi:hypothetical protein